MNKKIMGFGVVLASTLTMVFNYSTAIGATNDKKIAEIRQIDADEDMFEVTWEDMDADSYEIQYTANKLDWEKAVGSTISETNKVSVYNRIPGMTYYVRVRARYKIIEEEDKRVIPNPSNDEKDTLKEQTTMNPTTGDDNNTEHSSEEMIFEGEWSDYIDVVTTPKKNVTIIQTSATTDSASFKWDPVVGATYYNIYKKSSGDTRFYKKVTSNNVTVTGLGTGKKIDVVVAPVRTNKAGFATECYNVIVSSKIKLQPAKIKNISITSYDAKKKKATLTFSKQEGTKGAQIQLYKCDGKKPIWKGTTSSSSKVIPKIKDNQFYRVKMRAYTIIAGKKKYGAWSDYVYIGNQVTVNLKMVFNKIDVKWNSYGDATDYVVYASDDNVEYKKIKTLKSTKCKISKIGSKKVKSGNNYYVYVVARKKDKNKKYCSMVRNAFFLSAK
ncbi:MAG: fibronectin type III domain-containing protein [Lachnospiraceae bacterium]|nr:fibronectin type III domain-containing protein [Lachnospiraceae bacterium]